MIQSLSKAKNQKIYVEAGRAQGFCSDFCLIFFGILKKLPFHTDRCAWIIIIIMGNRPSAEKLEDSHHTEQQQDGKIGGKLAQQEDDEESTPSDEPNQHRTSDGAAAAANVPQKTRSCDSASLPKPDRSFYCFRRLCRELVCCQPWFHATEPVHDRALNIPTTFAPDTCTAFFSKCVLTGITGGTFAYQFFESEHPAFVMVYLTMWGNLACVLYLVLSTLNTVFAERTGQPQPATNLRIRTTWVLFELATHLSILASVCFYVFSLFLADDRMTHSFPNYALHGGIVLLVLINGLVIDRIPYRFQHYWGVIVPVEVLYCVWTYVLTLIGISDDDDESLGEAPGAVYHSFVEWTPDRWRTTLVVEVILVFAIGPIIYLILWSISNGLCCCRDTRRYEDDVDEKDTRPTVNDVEEGSIFGPQWSPQLQQKQQEEGKIRDEV